MIKNKKDAWIQSGTEDRDVGKTFVLYPSPRLKAGGTDDGHQL
ncbi:MAG: hypothetical protein ACLFST_15180 [Spirochaetia bacterium]